MIETDAAYLAKLTKRAIAETRELQAAVQANSDLLLVGQINDPVTLERLFTSALESNNPTRVAQVALAIEHQLGAMAIEEARSTAPGASRPAVEASLRVAEQLREWRGRESEKSPAVKKQRIQQRYEIRANELKLSVHRAAEAFGFVPSMLR